jgi:hypothetical protein
MILSGFFEYWVLNLVVFAYEFHLREDGTRGVASKESKASEKI